VTATARASLAAILIAGAAFGGAFYLGSHGANASEELRLGDNSGFALSVASIGTPVSAELVGLAYREIQRVYYRPVAPQTLINGERRGLLSYLNTSLKKQHVAPTLPAIKAGADESQDLQILNDQISQAQTRYQKQLQGNTNNLTEAALNGMVNSLGDPYTEYLSPDQIRQLNESLSGGNFGGVGVVIYQLKTHEIILQPIPNQPAARSGMHTTQVVTRINAQPVKGLPIDQVERLIRGPEGTVVTLTTHPYKGTTVHQYRITRQIIHLPTVNAKMENGFDYIQFRPNFGETSAAEMRKALLEGKAKGAKGYILDLRDNGGGLVDAAVQISSYFIPQGVIVTQIDRAGNQQSQSADGSYIPGLRPLAILVNGYTASASEITAGALEDHGVATLIGTRTFGKGVVQGIFRMPNGGALKITTERYLTPAGHDIQHRGIAPQIVVSQRPDPVLIDTPADKQLAAAKAFLSHSVR